VMIGFRFLAFCIALHCSEGFFLGFPGYNAQSAFCFLKGRSSRFLQFFAVCSETAMSRQDNFSFKVFVYIVAVCVLLCWYEKDIDFLNFIVAVLW
jgi:hypothetical protein